MLTFYLLAHIGTPAENILESNLAFILFGLGHFFISFFCVWGGLFILLCMGFLQWHCRASFNRYML